MKQEPEAWDFFQKAFPNGLTDDDLTKMASQVDDKAPFSQERFNREMVDLGELAYTEQLLAWMEFADIAITNDEDEARETALTPGFDYPELDEINAKWTAWIENYSKTIHEPLEPSIDAHLKESMKQMAEEEEADKKAFENM